MLKNLKNIRVILFFNGLRGLEVLKFLKKKKINIQYIFLSKKYLDRKIFTFLKKNSYKFTIINNLKSHKLLNIIKNKSDINIICGFPYIFHEKIINLNKFGTLNCHAGKLPHYRGGSPLNWQMINGEKKIGLSVIKIDSGIDTGDIVNSKTFLNKNYYTIKDLHRISNKLFPNLVFRSIKDILRNKNLLKQAKKNVKYYRQRSFKDSLIDLKNLDSVQLSFFVRALQDPYPNAFFYFRKYQVNIIKIKQSKISLKVGEIKFSNKKFFLGCKKGSVEVFKYKKKNLINI